MIHAVPDTTADAWQQAMYAFLAEKERHSGSRRTVEGYRRGLRHLFGQGARSPDQITCHEAVLEYSDTTVGVRGGDHGDCDDHAMGGYYDGAV